MNCANIRLHGAIIKKIVSCLENKHLGDRNLKKHFINILRKNSSELNVHAET